METQEVIDRITYFREAKGLTINALANKAGINQSVMRGIEKLGKQPTIETLGHICDALDINLSRFFSNDYQREKNNLELMTTMHDLRADQQEKLLAFINSVRT